MRVSVVDDDRLVAMSLKTILEADGEVEVVSVGYSGKDAVDMYKEYRPDVLLMDIRMGETNGLEAAENILNEYSDAKILLLTTFSDDEYIVKALNMGTKGYIIKQDFESILSAVKAVNMGQTVFGGDVAARLSGFVKEDGKVRDKVPDLSGKELNIVEQVAKGLNNKEIGEVLFLSEGTVRNYISSILDKLELRDRTQLAIYYLRNYG